MDNYQQVLLQMEEFGIVLRDKDVPLRLDTPKRVTCGDKGKDWYRLYLFRPDAGGAYVTGSYGTYRHGGDYRKVAVDWQPLSEAERTRMAAERAVQREAAARARQEEIANAAAEAIDLWRRALPTGGSPYLDLKQVQAEACRFVDQPMVLRWPARRPDEDDTVVRLPTGTLVVPLLRYDLPRHEALRGLQFIRPDGAKIYLRGFDKPGCAARLGEVDDEWGTLLLVCEGYATGLSLRMAVDGKFAVFVAFDAGNLAHVVPLLAARYPQHRILICADDDWQTRDRDTRELSNPGRTAARAVARLVANADFLWPHFRAATREKGDTDFNDLHVREGLDAVRRQLSGVVTAMARRYG
ncbi:toprim domain-containing protein [Xylophilus ampelinus]|uniref:Toprim domain-containing protein n=1 Tax=Xylophilus ampelinus TaxID=54067 RepID=A0A318SMF5_9BURK|nr:toprim domain-containing protein [Xylophilus ampelinus]MCS4509156.1 toprim domain-containing protein [Xylophilus ampelinus]PYE79818.1 Toprim domain-containing protein [Xylophilus ampelinus]